MVMSRERIQRHYQIMIDWNLEGRKNEAVSEEPGKMGYVQQWVRDGIYRAMGERWDIYRDG